MINILKIKVSYYDENSIIIIDDGYETFYLPESNRVFTKIGWCEDNKSLFNSSFSELDDGIYIVNKRIVSFNLINSQSFSDDNDEYENDIPYHLIWEDIKNELPNFDDKGVSNNIFSILINENCYQSYEGDYDSYIEYIGIINKEFNPDLIITETSRENKINREKEWYD